MNNSKKNVFYYKYKLKGIINIYLSISVLAGGLYKVEHSYEGE